MPGDEKALGQDVEAFVYGRKLPFNRQEKYGHAQANLVLFRGGSGNIPLMGMALLLVKDHAPAASRFWEEFFELSRKQGFMGRELQSRIYGAWHVISVLLVYSFGPSTLRAEAKAWLSCYASLLYMASDSKGRTCLGGMRSAGHEIHHDIYEWILAVALGTNEGRWSSGWKNRWEYQVLSKLKPQLKEALSTWRSTRDKRIHLSGFKPMVPVHFTKTKDAGAYWIEHNVNSNTPPWLAAKVENGKPAQILPANGGHRIRQKFDDATCHQEGNTVVYKGELYQSGDMTLPDGELVYQFVWGKDAEPVEPPDETPPGDPANEGDDTPPTEREPSVSAWQRFRNWLARIFG